VLGTTAAAGNSSSVAEFSAAASRVAAAASDDLRDKCQRTLSAIISVCDFTPALLALIPAAPSPVAKMVLRALLAVVSASVDARRGLLASGGLKAVQGLDPRARSELAAHGSVALRTYAQSLGPGAFLPPQSASALSTVAVGGGDEELSDCVAAINLLYPADVVAYSRPAYGLQLVVAAASRAKAVGEVEHASRVAARMQMEAAEAAALTAAGGGGSNSAAAAAAALEGV